MDTWFKAKCPALSRQADPTLHGTTPDTARSAHEAALCLQRARQHLDHELEVWAPAVDLFHRCRQLWRAAFCTWHQQLSNGSNLPDLLWLVQAHLNACAAPRTLQTRDIYQAQGEAAAQELITELEHALWEWQRPSRYQVWAERLDLLEDRAFHLLAHWSPTLRAADVEISPHPQRLFPPPEGLDDSITTDNRAHNRNYKEIQVAKSRASRSRVGSTKRPNATPLPRTSRVSIRTGNSCS